MDDRPRDHLDAVLDHIVDPVERAAFEPACDALRAMLMIADETAVIRHLEETIAAIERAREAHLQEHITLCTSARNSTKTSVIGSARWRLARR